MEPSSKQSEKGYLRRSGGGVWEASKPFPPAGQGAGEEHARHFQDFAVLLRVLSPTPSDLILDLGAGSCWVTEWLRRCGFNTVAVDISWDMLRLGAARLAPATGRVVGDMEALPFSDGTFSKACCLNAFHHIPEPEAALREIRRVLTSDGIAFFSEPGVGHASNPTSIAATRNYGVLEKEILIDQFMESCAQAGFADVILHPITNVMPLFALNRTQWKDWTRFTASQRPTRALGKIGRALMELAGVGKRSVLFEEAFAIRLLRELQPVIEQHPIVTAHRTPFTIPVAQHEIARIDIVAAPLPSVADTSFAIEIRVTNTGTTTWEHELVRIGIQLLACDGSVINKDYARRSLPSTLRPGDSSTVTAEVATPSTPGQYQLKIDLVREGVSWFELTGSTPITLRLETE